MAVLTQQQIQTCEENEEDFSKLKALFFNCTLKRTPEQSHTDGLIDMAKEIMVRNQVEVKIIRPVDYDIAYGVNADMTEEGWNYDDWPDLLNIVKASDIIVLTSPIWLGEKSSICTKVIERMYASSSEKNDKGQYLYYGKTGGCLLTGNEDGAKHCGMGILYALQHLGFCIPPGADAYWVGDAGPGPSYKDEKSGGSENKFTNRTTTFMAWNIMHVAHWLKSRNGFPSHGNMPDQWES